MNLFIRRLVLTITAAAISPALLTAQITHQQATTARLKTIFQDNQPKPKILLLGVFHFAGEQVDVNTTPINLRVDMHSPVRQKQVAELVTKLAAFKPTKIVIEFPPQQQRYLDSLYQEYVLGHSYGGKPWPVNETFAVGFKLAKTMKLTQVHAVDAQSFKFNLSPKDSVITFEKYKDQTDPSFDYWDNPYDALKAYDDSLNFYTPLKQYLLYLNSHERQARAIGRWLITTKRGTNIEPIGADGFITRYFNRNVRIYSNIQRVVTSKHDRVLVIYGATHLFFLRQLFEASPEFLLEDLNKYLK